MDALIRCRPGALALLAVFCLVVPVSALASGQPDDDFTDLSLEELMDVSIVSTSKQEVRLSDTAAAVYVITADDIRRMGYQSVPEALRLVPGVNVARINAASWAVTIRGFNGRFADKLLVMIDGRSVYTPLFSGVFWENLDVVMEDVERIEVVRGPGAAIWGANAVNGVINIITRNAADTQGGLLAAGGGDFEQFFGVGRYGGSVSETGDIRGFAKYRKIGATKDADGGDLNDDARLSHGGFRADWGGMEEGALSVQGTFNAVATNQSDLLFTGLTPPYSTFVQSEGRINEFALNCAWEKHGENGTRTQLKLWMDTTEVDYVATSSRVSRFDMEANFGRQAGKHNLVYGGAYRLIETTSDATFAIDFGNDQYQDWMLNAFINDDITLAPDRFHLTLGVKFEYATLGEFAIQPNIRLLWTPHDDVSFWASAARASRAPSIGSHYSSLTLDVVPPGTLGPGAPVGWVQYQGNPDVGNEDLTALEVGTRLMPAPWLAFDLATFFNDYENLLSISQYDPYLGLYEGTTYVGVPLVVGNDYTAETWGGELAMDFRPSHWFRLRGAWSLFRSTAAPATVDTAVEPNMRPDTSPEHQAHLWLSLDILKSLSAEGAWRYVDELAATDVPAYRELSARLGWRATSDLAFGVAGHNLLNEQHLEFVERNLLVSETAYIPRYWTVDARWEF